MKKIWLVFPVLFLFFIQSLDAQRWNLRYKNSIDLVVGGDLGFRFLESESELTDPDAKEQFQLRSSSEGAKSNFRIGFNYNFALTEKLFLKSGLRLSNPGYRASRIDSTLYQDEAPTGFFDQVNNYEYSYLFLEMPFMARYVYSDNWCKSYIEGGISANYYLNTRIKGFYADDATDVFKTKEVITPVNLSANVAIGAEFLIAKKIPAFIQLNFRYQFTDIKNNDLQENFIGAGVETGVRYVF